ncbi:MAG TPA: amino acid permease, partial [Rhizomicrobium sp.]|nr:amino acid permease [Rhizomicrobium sp.]
MAASAFPRRRARKAARYRRARAGAFPRARRRCRKRLNGGASSRSDKFRILAHASRVFPRGDPPVLSAARTSGEAALNRSIGLVSASAIVAGIILGTSIFVQPSEISRLVPNIAGMSAAWLLAGLLTLCGAMTCAELASAFPHTGGVYIFLKHGISPAAGFLWGWAMFWTMHSGIIAAIAVIVARYFGYFVSLSDGGVKAVAIGVIAALSAINYLGVRQGGILQAVLTCAKVLAIALIFVFVFAVAAPRSAAPVPLSLIGFPGFHAFTLAIGAGLFAFGGWHMVTYTAGETRDAA